MRKKLMDIERDNALQRLIDEQTEDLESTILFPELIQPLRPVVLAGLTPKEKASVILSVIGKLNNSEIGEALGVNESTVRGWIRRGYAKLRKKSLGDLRIHNEKG
jgi:RNA polymerase sigma factor (sigma-70 family)